MHAARISVKGTGFRAPRLLLNSVRPRLEVLPPPSGCPSPKQGALRASFPASLGRRLPSLAAQVTSGAFSFEFLQISDFFGSCSSLAGSFSLTDWHE